MNVPTLTETILKSLSIQQLYELSKVRNISAVEDEIARRLLFSDRYIEVINLLYDKRNEPSVKQWLESNTVQQGLLGAIPWKIGVIYDYRDQSYRINRIEVIFGKPIPYTSAKGYFKPTWLNSSQTNLVLREVINRTGHPINNVISIVTNDPNLDQGIRNALLNGNTAEITICNFLPAPGTSIKSYSNPLPQGEQKQMYPCYIKVGNFEHKLIDYPGNIIAYNPQTFNVPIVKSPEIEKLLQLKLFYNLNF